MKRADCKKGMKLRKVEAFDGHIIPKGEIVEVNEIIADGQVNVYTNSGEKIIINPKFYEPVKPKFENGAKVLYKTDMETFKARVWGSTYNSAGYYDYAIEVNNSWHTLAEEKELFPRKTADSLEIGDKFISQDKKVIVKAVEYDSYTECMTYFCKDIEFGMVFSLDEDEVGRILYEEE